ncbi:putative NADP(+)-dependent dehydrogenase [Hypoxylon sp. NC0597]|nr:putative NADP(+)-dependent dehydrogenase [Hypoxylon sp. NC0597]
MKPPMPSATPTWHNDTYAAISPQRPELSVSGKTVIITGAGSGIGRETAIAFASAGAAKIALLGRTAASLQETALLIPKETQTSIHAVDIAQEKAIQDVAKSVGKWDILVLAAGYMSKPSPITTADTDEWWQGFETNVKGTFIAIKSFAPTANQARPVVLAVTSGMTAAPASRLPTLSSYMASKLALTKMIEFLPVEQPNFFAATVHPGMVQTAILTKSGGDPNVLPMDKVQLPAHFIVWMSSPEATFLNGRSVWANWDVEELKTQAGTIQSGNQMTSGIYGWPFPHM